MLCEELLLSTGSETEEADLESTTADDPVRCCCSMVVKDHCKICEKRRANKLLRRNEMLPTAFSVLSQARPFHMP